MRSLPAKSASLDHVAEFYFGQIASHTFQNVDGKRVD